jgi:hypothetical protein
MSNHLALGDAQLMDQVMLKVDMSDCPVLAVVGLFSRERLEDSFRKSDLFLVSVISSIGVNIKGISKGIIELRPILHPSVGRNAVHFSCISLSSVFLFRSSEESD